MSSAIGRMMSRPGRRAGLADRAGFVCVSARAQHQRAHASLHGLARSVVLAAVVMCGMFCPVRGLADKPYVIPADLYVDMGAGAPGEALTAGVLDAATHGSGGTWRFRRGPGYSRDGKMEELTIAPMKSHLTVPVVVGGVTYRSHTGTRGWAFDLRTPVRSASFKFSDPHPAVSIGFFIEYHAPPKYVWVDLVGINAQDGDFVVFQTVENTSDRITHVHTGDHWGAGGGSKVGNPIQFEDDKLYWVSMRFVQHGESTLALFDPVTFKQLGPTSTLTLTSNSPTYDVVLGRTDNHGAIPSAITMYWDDLVVDWTHAAFPLIPRAQDGAAPSGLNPVPGR